jgi:eukaryotic-like serine/threonine-protein kinase
MDPPARIGRYEVLRLLGQGGMGRVFLARDTVLGRQVAVKIVRDDLGMPPEMKEALFARMRQEARAAATVSHPNMVVLHDMGEEPTVGLFLVFELIEGPTLRDRIAEEGPLPPDFVEQIARELGGALDRAHAAGVIHRDVKPENVLLAETGVKLTDFGIARLPDSTLTQAGSVLGTPAYSAPEALALGEFSTASDQFSLAATLYEAISGRRAFPGDDTMAVASRIATEDPPPLRRGPEGREMPRVGSVLLRGMAKDPRKRFASCTELSDAMTAALYGSVEPIRMSLPPPSIQPPARRRAQNILTAAALLTIVGLVTFGRHATSERDVDPDGASLRGAAEGFASAIEPKRAAPIVAKKPDVKPRAKGEAGGSAAGGDASTAAADVPTTDAGADAR